MKTVDEVAQEIFDLSYFDANKIKRIITAYADEKLEEAAKWVLNNGGTCQSIADGIRALKSTGSVSDTPRAGRGE